MKRSENDSGKATADLEHLVAAITTDGHGNKEARRVAKQQRGTEPT